MAVVEKGSEIGAHIMSGAVLEPTALNELFPDWQTRGAPAATPVAHDEFHFLTGKSGGWKVPHFFVPRPARNDGNYIVSLGDLCRWLGRQAEDMGVNLFPGFAAAEVLYDNGRVVGVATGDMGRDRAGRAKGGFPGRLRTARRATRSSPRAAAAASARS